MCVYLVGLACASWFADAADDGTFPRARPRGAVKWPFNFNDGGGRVYYFSEEEDTSSSSDSHVDEEEFRARQMAARKTVEPPIRLLGMLGTPRRMY